MRASALMFGPTLLSWMEIKAPAIYEAIREADRISRKTFSGHGSAIAQIYNHMIMPLATHRQKYTQGYWAVRDFEHRFGRLPEGMWLPETAVDLDTLEVLAELDIKFTILAPHQAKRWRRIGDREWSGAASRTRHHDALSRPAAIGPVSDLSSSTTATSPVGWPLNTSLNSGDNFARRLLGRFRRSSGARSWFISRPTAKRTVTIIATARWRSLMHPPDRFRHTGDDHQLRRVSGTFSTDSRSRDQREYGMELCARHREMAEPLRLQPSGIGVMEPGVAATPAHRAGQRGKARFNPLRTVRQRVLPRSVGGTGSLHRGHPRPVSPIDRPLLSTRYLARPLEHDERVKVLKLLEMQRHSMLMFTSCGWFLTISQE